MHVVVFVFIIWGGKGFIWLKIVQNDVLTRLIVGSISRSYNIFVIEIGRRLMWFECIVTKKNKGKVIQHLQWLESIHGPA